MRLFPVANVTPFLNLTSKSCKTFFVVSSVISACSELISLCVFRLASANIGCFICLTRGKFDYFMKGICDSFLEVDFVAVEGDLFFIVRGITN